MYAYMHIYICRTFFCRRRKDYIFQGKVLDNHTFTNFSLRTVALHYTKHDGRQRKKNGDTCEIAIYLILLKNKKIFL